MSESFALLLRDARQGDERAWHTLFLQHAPPLLGYLRGAGAPEPEDQLSEVFLQAARDIHQFAGDESQFRGWLFTIARHRMLDAIRAITRRPLAGIDFDSWLGTASESQDTAALTSDEIVDTIDLVRLLATLKPLEREVLSLRFIADLDTATVGNILRKRPNTVAAITRRALAKIRRNLPPA